jgi:1-acyl-sn-glycerol-3-phosphate acyltransferase
MTSIERAKRPGHNVAMNPWHYEPASDLDQPLIERLRRFPREPDMLVYGLRMVAAIFCRGWLRLYHRLTISGRENLPAEGSFVIVANHASHLDTICLLAALPFARVHRTFPAAARDYFFENAPRLLLAAIVVNALPFDRRNSPRQSLGLCHTLLEGPGNALILFPEGTRSATRELGEFKPGIGLLVAGTEHPVVPVYLEGTCGAWPKGAWLPRPWKVGVRIGSPLCYSGHKRGKHSAQQIAHELREAVLALARPAGDAADRSPREEIT